MIAARAAWARDAGEVRRVSCQFVRGAHVCCAEMTGTPHDALFKGIFSAPDVAAAELSSVLPKALSEAIDWRSLQLVPGSFVDEKLEKRESDLLFEASVIGASSRWVRLYLLFEHQSTVDGWMPFRVLRYMVRIWEQEQREAPERETLTPIVPVLLHHSATGWTAASRFEELLMLDGLEQSGIEEHLPLFSLVIDDVSHQSDEQIAARTEHLLVRLALASLREARRSSDGPAVIRTLASLLREVRSAEGRREAYGMVLRYLLTVAVDGDPGPFLQALATEVDPEAKDDAMGLLDSMLEKGRAEGLAKGLAKGRRTTLLKLLTLKFRLPVTEVDERVASLSDDDVERALEAVLDATSLDDVLGR